MFIWKRKALGASPDAVSRLFSPISEYAKTFDKEYCVDTKRQLNISTYMCISKHEAFVISPSQRVYAEVSEYSKYFI